jgi:deoxycytidine triphosphate deaminase
MILSNKDIREAILAEHVVLDPLVPDNIRKSSIDVRLGQWFWRCDEAAGVYNPRDKANRDRYFAVEEGPKLAKPYESVFKKIAPNSVALLDTDTYQFFHAIFNLPDEEKQMFEWPIPVKGVQTFAGIENDWPVIVMKPRETILAHTIEFVGIQPPGTSEMRARSTWGRNGLGVCKCAGAGDPGYINRWTFELTNFNNVPLIIPVGERIAQLILHVTGDVEDGQYGAETGNYKSNYQSGATLEELKLKWTPYDMLPKPSKDKLVLPPDYDPTPFTTNKP